MDDEFDYVPAPSPTGADRRRFLTAAVATVAAAAVTGGTAALLLEEKDVGSTASIASTVTSSPPLATATSAPSSSHLQVRLTALEAENRSLQENLSAARRQLAAYSGAIENGTAGADVWQRNYEEASTQAADLANQLGVLQGLIALYEELEVADLAAVAASGVAAVSGMLGGLVADVPAVSEGLQAGRQALDEFEEQLPFVEQGRRWLEDQMLIIQAALDAAETALNGAVQAGGSFMQLLNRWFDDIVKWLPFGIGERASGIMAAVGDLLAEVPKTLHGLQSNIAGPLDMWLDSDGDENRLQRRLVKPVREDAIGRAGTAIEQIDAVGQVYETQLREPVMALAERQRQIREQIANYRQSHNM